MSASNDIKKLRNHLFQALDEISDPNAKPDYDRLKALNELSQTIISSAKIEVDFLNAVGGLGTGFIVETTKIGATK